MTYTTASGVVIPVGTDAFSPTAQFKTWADKAATYENILIAPLDTDRTALATPELRDGILCYVKSTKIMWQYVGTTWKAWESGWITYTPTTIAGVTLGTGGTGVYEYQYTNGDVRFKWRIQLGTGGTWSIPTFTLPSPVAAEHTLFTKMGAGALTTFSSFWEVTANYIDAATGVRMYCLGGNPVTYAVISASAPVAVSAGTVIAGRGQYTPA